MKRLGSIGQFGKVSQQKHPFVKMTFELIKGFFEFGQFDVDEFKLFVEDFTALIFQFDHMQKGLVGFVIVKNEVENSDGVDSAEFKVPFAFEGLFLNRESGVVDTAVFKEVLFGFLDFNDEAFAVLGLAIDVEDGFTINSLATKLLGVFEGEVLDVMMDGQKRVQKVDQQPFVRFSSEDAFEAKVGEEADVAVLEGINHESGTLLTEI